MWGKSWKLYPEHCAICEQLVVEHPNPIAVDDAFYNAGDVITYGDGKEYLVLDEVQTHPLHPNCRCSVLPVRKKS